MHDQCITLRENAMGVWYGVGDERTRERTRHTRVEYTFDRLRRSAISEAWFPAWASRASSVVVLSLSTR